MGQYWIPSTKAKLVDWLVAYWPDSLAKFKRMRKTQLYAIYYSKLHCHYIKNSC